MGRVAFTTAADGNPEIVPLSTDTPDSIEQSAAWNVGYTDGAAGFPDSDGHDYHVYSGAELDDYHAGHDHGAATK